MVKNVIFIKKSPKLDSARHQSTITMSYPRLAENLAVNKNIGTMSSPRLAGFSAVKICCDLLSCICPRLAENLAVKKNMSCACLAEFSAVKICCDLLSSPRLAENLAVNKNIGTMSSRRLAEFFSVKNLL